MEKMNHWISQNEIEPLFNDSEIYRSVDGSILCRGHNSITWNFDLSKKNLATSFIEHIFSQFNVINKPCQKNKDIKTQQ